MKGSKSALSTPLRSSKVTKAKLTRSDDGVINERRVATPRPDLIVVKIGGGHSQRTVLAQEKASTLISKITKATSKPGTSRKTIFRSSVGKTVYAFSVFPKDTTKFVREDANGNKLVGRFVNGSFRALSS